MPDISHLLTKAVLNTTASKIENKIPNTSSFFDSPESNGFKK